MDPIILQKHIRENAQDVQNYMLDLKSWEEEMKRKEQQLCSESADKDATPVRTKARKSSKYDHTEKEDIRKEGKPKKSSPSDYATWNKVDVDKAREFMDSEEELKVLRDHHEKFTSEIKIRDEASYEKEMGNKLVKQLKWNEALHCYTRAIQRYSFDAIFYANRALCHLKLNNFKAAEADCSKALELDPGYVKAYQRRATARIELQRFQEARSDLQNVLKLEPNNSFIKGQLSKLDQKLAENERVLESEEKSVQEKSINIVGTLSTCTAENGDSNRTGQQIENQSVVLPIFKPPHLRSKKPLKRIEIKEVTGNIHGEYEKLSQTISEDNACMNTNPQPEVQDKGTVQGETPCIQNEVDNNLDKSSDVQVPPVPASSVQFISAWNTVKSKRKIRFHYLKQISGDKIPTIFRESMESSMLSEIITTLAEDFLQHGATVYPYLKGLSEVRRFGALAMFLSKNDKSGLERLLNYCEANKECAVEETAFLRNKYEL